MGYEMIRSELTTTSIETGKKFDGRLFYDPRFGQSEIRSTGFITRNLLDAGGNWTDFGLKHLDEETRASWKEIATRDIIATYEKAGGNANNMVLPIWVRQQQNPPTDSDINEFENTGQLSANNAKGLQKAFELKQFHQRAMVARHN